MHANILVDVLLLL